MDQILKEAQELQGQMIAWRRALHQIPETGLYLPKTAEFIKNVLTEIGLAYQEYDGHSGITACIGQGKKTVAVRADMDGLPIREESGLSFASQNGAMHACGHDAHMAILLGAAKILKDHESELKGRIKLIFQPAEEGPGGAACMVQDGVMKDVDFILALHVGELAGHFDTGHIAVSYGETFAADDEVVIEVKGVGGHASLPNLCVDPVAISTLIINNLQYIISREIDPFDASVLTIATVEAGMGVCNIIPSSAKIRGNIRNTSPDTRCFVQNRIREIAQKSAEMMRAKCEVFFAGYPALVNDRAAVDTFLCAARRVVGEDSIHILPHGILGGEDAAFFFQEAPGCYFFLANGAPCPADGVKYGVHHPRFCMDESVFWRGASLFCMGALEFLER